MKLRAPRFPRWARERLVAVAISPVGEAGVVAEEEAAVVAVAEAEALAEAAEESAVDAAVAG